MASVLLRFVHSRRILASGFFGKKNAALIGRHAKWGVFKRRSNAACRFSDSPPSGTTMAAGSPLFGTHCGNSSFIWRRVVFLVHLLSYTKDVGLSLHTEGALGKRRLKLRKASARYRTRPRKGACTLDLRTKRVNNYPRRVKTTVRAPALHSFFRPSFYISSLSPLRPRDYK